MRISLTLLLCALINGCFYESNLPEGPEIELTYEESLKQSILEIDDLRVKLEELDLTDGVSFDEANTILGNFYFSDKADGCGAPGNIVDNGNQWKAATFVGISAKRSNPIYIDKITGSLERNNEILVTNPKTLTFKDPVYYIEAKKQIEKAKENLQNQ